MSAERQFNRRDLLKNAAAMGIALSALPRVSYGQENEEVAQNESTGTTLPSYIPPTEISYNDREARSEAIRSTETTPKDFAFIPFTAHEMPVDWIHQVGIAFNGEIDLFTGPFYDDIQTLIWANSLTIETGTTAEDMMNQVWDAMRSEQTQALNNRPDLDADNYTEGRAFLTEIAGFDGWSIDMNMPGQTQDTHNYLQDLKGFISDEQAFFFNLQASYNRPGGMDERVKFNNMVNSLQPK